MMTSYTDLNAVLARRTGLKSFDFEQADDRAAVGHLLGLIVKRDHPTSGLMISALVHYLDANDAGPGFYVLAEQFHMIPPRAPKRRMTQQCRGRLRLHHTR